MPTFYQFRREPQIVQELEEVRLEYSRKHDCDLFLMLGEIYRGWLLAEEGRREDGAPSIQHGLAVYQAVGAELGRPTFLGVFADVCGELELRAAMSLSRLRCRQSRIGEAHASLSEAYQLFTEGFETPDLTEARALLEQLDGGRPRPAPIRGGRARPHTP